MKQLFELFRKACKEERMEKLLETQQTLEQSVDNRIEANKNASNLYQERINQLEQQLKLKEEQMNEANQV